MVNPQSVIVMVTVTVPLPPAAGEHFCRFPQLEFAANDT